MTMQGNTAVAMAMLGLSNASASTEKPMTNYELYRKLKAASAYATRMLEYGAGDYYGDLGRAVEKIIKEIEADALDAKVKEMLS